ncbi:serine/threonine-protein kinase [Serratia sp. DD3]|uniref:serine/threonine protein kinase n=1 Tax=Serratia sp. DD3 TaxID=1410619 RepID=UPI0003C507BF|nr:serine/threonine-protein kinase [Serratia sp. DD3]
MAKTLTPGRHAQALNPGYHLARLEIQQAIGEGGFSIVYQAFDHGRKHPVAVKEYFPVSIATRKPNGEVIPHDDCFLPTFNAGRTYFRQEARILDVITHPCVPQLFDFWQENNTAYISTSLYRGNTLKKCHRETPDLATQSWLMTLLTSLLNTVYMIHQQGCLHLDISWDNIQIQDGASPILLDFGSACFTNNHSPNRPNLMLKPGFSPPELYYRAEREAIGPWCDIYSIGALIYGLITGTLPPVSLTRCIEDRYQPLSEQRPNGYSYQFLRAIDQALAVSYVNRPQTLATFAQQLDIKLSSSDLNG